jgi:hypothetical protein
MTDLFTVPVFSAILCRHETKKSSGKPCEAERISPCSASCLLSALMLVVQDPGASNLPTSLVGLLRLANYSHRKFI